MRPEMTGFLACVATRFEGRMLLDADVPVLVTGIGPVTAAIALTRRLARDPVGRIVVCGVGGAYPGSGLKVGDVACAESETYGDLGADAPEGYLDMESLGFAVVGNEFNTLALDLFPAERRARFVTCSTCTGTDGRANELQKRTGGAVESMEGAALVQVAKTFGIPIGELRGISNFVGNRDRSGWRLDEAASAAQETLLQWLNG